MLKPTTIVKEVSEDTFKKMLDFYEPFMSEPPNPYIVLFARNDAVSLSVYAKNKKGIYKAVFQGQEATNEANIWEGSTTSKVLNAPSLAKKKSLVISSFPQIGSDEVGTGDFFGPVIVCAAYLRKEDMPLVEELGVTDSKKMEDSYILSIGPRLINSFDYSELSLPPNKFNEVHDEFNMNAIKAKMHNRCLLNLKARHPEASLYQDQFAEASLYYHYLSQEKEIAEPIRFSTKGELAFPSVALASVIARYSFLRKMAELGHRYGVSFPFGAGENVDTFAKNFLKSHSKDELKEVAKLSFANAKKLL
jgi:ribonuclease HIII